MDNCGTFWFQAKLSKYKWTMSVYISMINMLNEVICNKSAHAMINRFVLHYSLNCVIIWLNNSLLSDWPRSNELQVGKYNALFISMCLKGEHMHYLWFCNTRPKTNREFSNWYYWLLFFSRPIKSSVSNYFGLGLRLKL